MVLKTNFLKIVYVCLKTRIKVFQAYFFRCDEKINKRCCGVRVKFGIHKMAAGPEAPRPIEGRSVG